jgi:malate dehydrogenase (oxaloacetate-decarboxylating)
LCQITNEAGVTGHIPEAMKDADVVIAYSTPGPGTIKPEWVRTMAEDAIIFAGANPVPEIWPWEAKEAGAAVIATGRSDFPNQVNNSLIFPAVFRGALDVRAKTITDEMCFVAAEALAGHLKQIDAEHLLPTMDNWEVYAKEAAAVGMKAQEMNLARLEMSYEQLYQNAFTMIKRSHDLTETMMANGFIAKAPV